MLEVAFQTKIIEAFKDQAGTGYKSNNRYVVGVPDVHITSPPTGAWLIEAKMVKVPKAIVATRTMPAFIPNPKIGTTPNQVQFMKNWIKGGGRAMVMVALHSDNHHWIWATTEVHLETVNMQQVFHPDEATPHVIKGRYWSPAIIKAFHRALDRAPTPC